MGENRVDVDKIMWDQSTFVGRFQYFAWMSNPMNGLVTNKTLIESKELLEKYREGKEPPGTAETEVLT